jgi:hypothetical protein
MRRSERRKPDAWELGICWMLAMKSRLQRLVRGIIPQWSVGLPRRVVGGSSSSRSQCLDWAGYARVVKLVL